ncbi:hypothetical protein D3C86_2256980 [compost metagenome]
MPGVQHEQHAWGELHQADQPEVEYVARQLVQVPADGHREHLKTAGGENPGQPEREKRTMVT